MEPLRWGILGSAKIARTVVAPGIHAADHAVLAALATTRPERALPFAAMAPGLRLHETYEALIDDPGIDAVYVPLPNHLHVEWTRRALDAGKHVLCEKPLALAAGEIDGLIAARDAAERVAAEAFMVLSHPQWHRAKALVDDGAIGPLVHIEGAFTYRNTDPANIRNRPETGGGGLWDIGVYPAITARYVTGAEPVGLRADIQREGGVDTFARVWADFPGVTMAFTCGMRQAPRQEMTFQGETGWLRLTAPFNAALYGDTAIELRRADGTMTIERFNGVNQYRAMIEDFGRAVRDGIPPPCTLEVSRGNAAMIEAILAAG